MRVRIKAKAQNAILAAYADKCGSIRAAAESLGVTATTYGKWLNFHSSFRGVGGKGKGSYSAEKAVEMIKILETETGHRAEEIFQLKKSEMNLLAKPRVYEREVSRKALEDYASHTAQRLEYQPPRDEEISLPDAIRDCLQRSKLSDRYKQVIIYKVWIGWSRRKDVQTDCGNDGCWYSQSCTNGPHRPRQTQDGLYCSECGSRLFIKRTPAWRAVGQERDPRGSAPPGRGL